MFVFIDEVKNKADSLVVNIREEIHDEKVLFKILSSGLNFPGYFGFNWHALNDCLKDLEWLTEENILLMHKDLPFSLNVDQFNLYLRVLYRVDEWWKRYDDKNIIISFPVENEEYIKGLLSNFPPLQF